MLKDKDYRIVMTILVKNEADIIETNIKTHAKLGVDGFVVMDNGSTDGTREILSRLQKEFEMVIVDEKGLYSQSKFMMRLAKIAKKRLGANWVINNDADEFWLPRNGLSLKENLNFNGAVLTVQRYNMILEEGKPFVKSNYFVENPIFYTKEKQLSGDVSIVLTKIAPKTIVNPNGLIYLRGGNHKALHIKSFRDYFRSGYDKIKRFKAIEVFHFPIRSYEQFEKNIKNRKVLLESQKRISMGPHYRRWVELFKLGRLKEEFEKNILFRREDIAVLEKYSILKFDETIKNTLVV